ncbi:hypothetical protein [Kutzneria sp. NPDC051319]
MTEGHEPTPPEAGVANDMSGEVTGHAVQTGNVGATSTSATWSIRRGR